MSDEKVQWMWVSLPYATFGIAVRGTRVVDAARIAYWAKGRSWSEVLAYYKRKGAEVVRL